MPDQSQTFDFFPRPISLPISRATTYFLLSHTFGSFPSNDRKCVTEPGNVSRNDVMCLIFNFEKGCGHTGLPRPFHTEQKPTNEFCF